GRVEVAAPGHVVPATDTDTDAVDDGHRGARPVVGQGGFSAHAGRGLWEGPGWYRWMLLLNERRSAGIAGNGGRHPDGSGGAARNCDKGLAASVRPSDRPTTVG